MSSGLKGMIYRDDFDGFKEKINRCYIRNENVFVKLEKKMIDPGHLICVKLFKTEYKTILNTINPILIKKKSKKESVIKYCIENNRDRYIIYLIENGYYNFSEDDIKSIYLNERLVAYNVIISRLLIKRRIIDINRTFNNGENLFFIALRGYMDILSDEEYHDHDKVERIYREELTWLIKNGINHKKNNDSGENVYYLLFRPPYVHDCILSMKNRKKVINLLESVLMNT